MRPSPEPKLTRGLDLLERLASRDPLDLPVEGFLFLRHGETEGNRLRVYQRADQPLNDRGLAQAREAAGVLAEERVATIVASTMARAWRTAEIVAEGRGMSPVPSDGLRERWFGDFVGTSSAEIDWALAPPNGETLETFVARARVGFAEALAAGPDTLVVSHGGVLNVLAASLGVALSDDQLTNATPLRFTREAGTWRARRLGGLVTASGQMS